MDERVDAPVIGSFRDCAAVLAPHPVTYQQIAALPLLNKVPEASAIILKARSLIFDPDPKRLPVSQSASYALRMLL